MSNGNETKLEGINKVLRFNSIFFSVGVFVLMIGFLNTFQFGLKLWAIGWGIIGLPKIIAALFSGFWGAVSGPLKADYEVVTVDGLGRTISSDGGAQSIQGSSKQEFGYQMLPLRGK
jgi:hypothetical protein